ncbi:MAG TPA: hypothetical protein VMU88_07730 [bacterium]|nr:hypothetical protein [bacterium]
MVVAVRVAVAEGVEVPVGVAVKPGVWVIVGVPVTVDVAVLVLVAEGVLVNCEVRVEVGVLVGLFDGPLGELLLEQLTIHELAMANNKTINTFWKRIKNSFFLKMIGGTRFF